MIRMHRMLDLVVVSMCASVGMAQVKEWSPPHPSATVLREIAAGQLRPGTLRQALADCTGTLAKDLGGCGPNLADVLVAYSKVGVAQHKVILDALEGARPEAGPGPAAEFLASTEARVKGRSAAANALSVQSGRTAPWYVTEAAGQGPPTRSEMRHIPFSLYKARLLNYVDGFLPADPTLRITEAFRAATARDCASDYNGQVVEVCEDLGLSQIQWASLWLAVADLRNCKGDPDVVGRYLKLDSSLLEEVMDSMGVQSDESLRRYGGLLRKWSQKAPTRWQAWADLEATFVPALN